MDNLALAMPGVISIRESRAADGLDRYIPIILRNGDPYDADLDRFFLELPLSGVRSPHSLRAYGYDIAVWVRFLETACGKTVWTATHADIDAFHRARRRDDAQSRVSAASWNRSIAVLDKLYSWAQSEGLVATSPFRHRHIWRQGHGTARARILARNQSYERAAKRSDVRFISLEDYRVFRDVGLRGLMADGAERPGGKDRNGTRNALFAELLVTTGLRLSEASFLLAVEIADLARQAAHGRQTRFELPCALTKGERGKRLPAPAPPATNCFLHRCRARPCRLQVQAPRSVEHDRAADFHSSLRAPLIRIGVARRRYHPVRRADSGRARAARHLRQRRRRQ